ncbi:MAG: VTT domain-containing protein [Caldilineaceae bacterium]
MNWQQLLQIFGYPLIALGIGLESIGLPTPGETLVLIGAVLAANGQLNIYFVVVSAALGAIAGDNVGYFLGRRYGPVMLTRLLRLDEGQLHKSERFFQRHGPKTVFLARFIPVLRMLAAPLAGSNHMPARTFIFYNALGGIIWAIYVSIIGYFFGQNLPLVERIMRRMGVAIVVLVVVALLLFWVNRRWQRNEERLRTGLLGKLLNAPQRLFTRLTVRSKTVGIVAYLALLVGAGWLCGFVIDAWLEQDPLLFTLDRALTPWLKGGVTESPLWVDALAWLGDLRLLLAVTLVAALWQLRQQRRYSALLTLLNTVGALALAWGLQLWLQRPLPPEAESYWGSTSYSLPNLSALLTVVVYGWLALFFGWERTWPVRINLYTLAAFAVIGNGVLVLVQSQGFLSDLCTGWAIGVLWLGLPLGLFEWLTRSFRSLRF